MVLLIFCGLGRDQNTDRIVASGEIWCLNTPSHEYGISASIALPE
jgi:hypothetical protein